MNKITQELSTVASQEVVKKSCLKKKQGKFGGKKVSSSHPFKMLAKSVSNLFKSKATNERTVKVHFNEKLQIYGTNPVIDTPWRHKLNKKMNALNFDKSSLRGKNTEDILFTLYDKKIFSKKEFEEIIMYNVDLEACHFEASDKEFEDLKDRYEALVKSRKSHKDDD